MMQSNTTSKIKDDNLSVEKQKLIEMINKNYIISDQIEKFFTKVSLDDAEEMADHLIENHLDKVEAIK